MFATEVKFLCKTRPATAILGTPAPEESDYAIAQRRLRYVKEKAKEAERKYQSVLSNVSYLKKSIDTFKHQTCQKRLNFMKSFESKKAKIKSQELEQQRKLIEETEQAQLKKKNKILKLNSELQSLVNKCEQEKAKEYLRSKSKVEKERIKSIKREKDEWFETIVREKYEKAKDEKLLFDDHKNRRINFCMTRSQKNYQMRIDQEKNLIASYNKILDDVEELKDYVQNGDSTLDTRTIFITSKLEDCSI